VTLVKPPAVTPPDPTAGVDGEGEVRLAREITFLDATMLGVGALMGGGVFVLLGLAAGVAGNGLLVALFLNGFLTIPTLMVYAELGSASDDAGGGYLWVKDGLGQPFGFLGGWLGWFSHIIACSLYTLASAAFAAYIMDAAGWVTLGHRGVQLLALSLAAMFVGLNYMGVKVGIKAENTINLAVLGVVVVFIGFGLYAVGQHPETVTFNLTPFFPTSAPAATLSTIFLAMGITFIAFEGYEIISQTSEEIQDPKRNIPKAIWAAFLLVWGIMLVVAFIALGVTDAGGEQGWTLLADAKEHALIEVAGQVMPYGAVIIAGSALLLQITALNATIYSSSRVSFAMGRDGNLPRLFGKIHAQRRTPHFAVLGSGVLVLLMALLPIEHVAVSADVMFLLLFLLVNLAYIKLRKTIPEERFGFRAPLFPWLPLVGIGGQAFIAIYLWKYSHLAWYVTLLWIAVGLVLYYAYVRPHETHEPAVEPRPAFAARPPDRLRKAYRILVLLSSPAPSTARNLARTAGSIAKSLDGEVLLLAPVIVPEVTPLDEGRRLFRGSALLQEARGAVPAAVPVHTLVRIGHNLDAVVREVVREEGVSLLLLSGIGKATVGQPTSPLIAFPPCDIAMLRHRQEGPAGRVLVTSHGEAQAPLAVRLGTAVAKAYGGEAVLYHVRTDGGEPADARAAWGRTLLDHHAVAGVKAELELAEGGGRDPRDPVPLVVGKAKDYDLVVVGASTPRPWSKALLGPRTQAIADRTQGNVLIVRRRDPGGAMGRRMMLLRRYFLPE
jgi:amino acid transporter/nucleotide-binding universal stress UspA family protein